MPLNFCYVVSNKEETMLQSEFELNNLPAVFNAPATDKQPVGTLFLRLLNLLPEILKNYIQSTELFCFIMKERINHSIGYQNTEDILTNCVVCCLLEIPNDKYLRQYTLNKVDSFILYIKTCIEERKWSLKTFEKFIFRIGETIKTPEEVIPYIETQPTYEPMNPDEVINLINSNEHSEDNLHFYRIESIIDLLSACFREILLANKCINKCAYCGRYFVPDKRTDTMYCNFKNPEQKNKSCAQLADLSKRRIRYKQEECRHIDKLICSLFYARSNYASDEDSYKILGELTNYRNKRDEYKKSHSVNTYKKWLKRKHKFYKNYLKTTYMTKNQQEKRPTSL